MAGLCFLLIPNFFETIEMMLPSAKKPRNTLRVMLLPDACNCGSTGSAPPVVQSIFLYSIAHSLDKQFPALRTIGILCLASHVADIREFDPGIQSSIARKQDGFGRGRRQVFEPVMREEP